MGIEQGEVVVHAVLKSLLAQFIGVAAGFHRQPFRPNLRVERALARQPVGHFAEGGLDGLFVAISMRFCTCARSRFARRASPRKMDSVICGRKLQAPEPALKISSSDALAAPVRLMAGKRPRARRRY